MKALALVTLALGLLAGPARAEITVAELAPWLDSLPPGELKRQLAQLPSPSARDDQGQTLLHHAVCTAPEQIPVLLSGDVDPTLADRQGATALHRFFRCGHPARAARLEDVTATLLDAGAPLDAGDNQQRQPLHAALAAMPEEPATVDIYRDAARLMLARGADAQAADDAGLRPLHLAARKASPEVVTLLLDAGAGVDATDPRGRTPLWWAARGRHNLRVFEALLAAGANPAIFPDGERSAAARAAASRAWRKLDLLLQLLPEPRLPESLATPVLARALWEDAPMPVIRRIHDTGASVAALPGQGGGDLAWYLAEKPDAQRLDWLLARDFPLNERPPSGYPPLFFASLAASQRLLARGADPTLASSEDGTVMAAFIPAPPRFEKPEPHFNADKVTLLLEAGYPVNLRDPQNRTALERAVKGDRLWLVKQLLQAGADPRLTSDTAPSLVPHALEQGRLPMIRTLILALPDFAERHQALVLDYIRGGGQDPAVVDLLLASGAALRITDSHGNTPLLWAARQQHWPVVSLLLDQGADPQRANDNGCDLDCYTWRMPAPLAQRLRQNAAPTPLERLPRLNDRPAAFFAVTLSPMLALYLLVVARRLHQQRSLLTLALDALVAASLTVIGASMLFYQCQRCLLSDPHQAPASAALALLLFSGLRSLRTS